MRPRSSPAGSMRSVVRWSGLAVFAPSASSSHAPLHQGCERPRSRRAEPRTSWSPSRSRIRTDSPSVMPAAGGSPRPCRRCRRRAMRARGQVLPDVPSRRPWQAGGQLRPPTPPRSRTYSARAAGIDRSPSEQRQQPLPTIGKHRNDSTMSDMSSSLIYRFAMSNRSLTRCAMLSGIPRRSPSTNWLSPRKACQQTEDMISAAFHAFEELRSAASTQVAALDPPKAWHTWHTPNAAVLTLAQPAACRTG